MLRANHVFLAPALALALAAFAPGDAAAQKKIVCWKDKAGKVVGCGDTVPPEFQDSATKELDKRGVTRATTETTADRLKREAEEKQLAAQKGEEKKRLEKLAADQRRQDQALINTFSDEKEIDLKRDRDLQVVDGQITQLRVSHKNAQARHAEVKGRIDAGAKAGKPATAAQKEDMDRAQADMDKAEQSLVIKEKEKDDIRKKYAEMRERYTQLRSGTAPAPTTAAAKK